ncbi:MAG: GIY-YIG nuclease family protein [Candidatus Colwellbacteria bacterium]|nr:GIY-YIG nuclease family protein [Candidatus Colwellbacteria bacterium]
MYYVYALRSLKDNKFYVGSTKDLENRLSQHERGQVPSTKNRRPLKFIYCEISNSIKDATHREKYLKTAWGKRYLRERVKNDKNNGPIR